MARKMKKVAPEEVLPGAIPRKPDFHDEGLLALSLQVLQNLQLGAPLVVPPLVPQP